MMGWSFSDTILINLSRAVVLGVDQGRATELLEKLLHKCSDSLELLLGRTFLQGHDA